MSEPTPFTPKPEKDTVDMVMLPPQLVAMVVEMIDENITGKNARGICNTLESCPTMKVPKEMIENAQKT